MRLVVARVVLWMCFLATGAVAQQDTLIFHFPTQLDITGGGARALGMGGAFIGVSNDASAVTWNPAGLRHQEKPMLAFELNSLVPRGQFLSGGRVFEQTPSFNDLGMASFIAPVRLKGHPFVGALSFTRIENQFENFGSVGTLRIDPDGAADKFDSTTQVYERSDQFHSGLEAINIGFGTPISEKISAGAALNVHSGKAINNVKIRRTTPATSRTDPLTDFQVGTEIKDSMWLDTTSYTGLNVTVGLSYEGERLSLGLVVQSPYTLKLDTDRKTTHVREFNGLPDPGDSGIVFNDNQVVEIDMPVVIGGGFGYHLSEHFLVSGDAEFRGYGSSDGRIRTRFAIVPGAKDIEEFADTTLDWDNVLTFRLGSEYLWQTGSEIVPEVPLRAGFAYVPFPEKSLRLDQGKLVRESVDAVRFTLGTGAHWGQIHLDAAWSYTTYDGSGVRFIRYGGEGVPAGLDGLAVPLDGDLEGRQHEFRFTFTGVF